MSELPVTQSELARRLGWSRQLVAVWLKKIGIEPEKLPGMPHTYIPGAEADEVCRRLREARENRQNHGGHPS